MREVYHHLPDGLFDARWNVRNWPGPETWVRGRRPLFPGRASDPLGSGLVSAACRLPRPRSLVLTDGLPLGHCNGGIALLPSTPICLLYTLVGRQQTASLRRLFYQDPSVPTKPRCETSGTVRVSFDGPYVPGLGAARGAGRSRPGGKEGAKEGVLLQSERTGEPEIRVSRIAPAENIILRDAGTGEWFNRVGRAFFRWGCW